MSTKSSGSETGKGVGMAAKAAPMSVGISVPMNAANALKGLAGAPGFGGGSMPNMQAMLASPNGSNGPRQSTSGGNGPNMMPMNMQPGQCGGPIIPSNGQTANPSAAQGSALNVGNSQNNSGAVNFQPKSIPMFQGIGNIGAQQSGMFSGSNEGGNTPSASQKVSVPMGLLAQLVKKAS